MPSRPKRRCPRPGCPELVDGRYCDRHRRAARRLYDDRRGSAAERGYDGAWRRARVGYLRKHPLCRACEAAGTLTPAAVVDHVEPHRGDKTKFWDAANWQPLCKRCHDEKTAREDGGFGRGERP